MTFKLTNRLIECKNLIPKTESILDIGADRGYLAVYLEKNNIVNKVFASENKIGPYKSLEKTIKENNSNVIPLFGDGLNVNYNNVETISILGMGGKTIFKILNENKEKLDDIKYILISPQSSFFDCISLLYELGFYNINGKYIFETHYYPVLLFEKGESNTNIYFQYFGSYPLINKDNNLYKYLLLEKKRYTSIGYKHNKNNNLIYNVVLGALKEYYND